jgi:hypothetical protein
MKIDKTGLHPIYDQYENAENRLTHALLHTIGSSNSLFRRFLKELMRIPPGLITGRFEISTQKIPLSHGDRDPEEVESIPDAWIVDGSSQTRIGIAVEVKDRKNSVNLSQLRKHVNRIKNYRSRYLLVITPDLKRPQNIAEFFKSDDVDSKVTWLSWGKIYVWLKKVPAAVNSREGFLIDSLLEFLERRREVLGFQGISFSGRFNVIEAKDILNAEMEELAPFVEELYIGLNRRRPAITTFSQDGVWDCFGSGDGFTKDLHFTFGINENQHDIDLVVPNSARKAWARLKKVFSSENDLERLLSILKNLRDGVPHLYMEFNQRHFVAPKFGVRDGFLEFNIDTMGAPFRKMNSETKEFPVWIDAISAAVTRKRNINGQFMIKARFFLGETDGIDRPEFIATAKRTIKAFKPLYDFLKV